ncbi:MAG TPA: DUF2264 domain-containing protein [Pedobacter sp.]|jgi:hypothetical protein
MMNRLLLLLSLLICASTQAISQTKDLQATNDDRKFWLSQLDKIARPVFLNLANDQLTKNMSVELSIRSNDPEMRIKVAPLEAFARTFCGIAPWLNLEGGNAEEVALRNQYREWALKAVSNAVNPASKDYMYFTTGQSVVDASFIAVGFVRCPWVWKHLTKKTQKQVVDAFKLTSKINPPFNNWLLFVGMIEAFYCKYNMPWDPVRVEFGMRQFEQWYIGDATYKDGESYHHDYYNSFVIYPYLAQISKIINAHNGNYKGFLEKFKKRSERYAIIQERLINADGSFPATGRSIVYRGAVFQHLADMALRESLPQELHPAQVRGALTAVIRKTLESPTTFNQKGWLTIGLFGAQPNIADTYNNTGSLYLNTTIFLPLGLPESNPFWSAPARDWSSKKIWSGSQDVINDHAID